MEWLAQFFKKYHLGFLSVVASMLSISFIVNLISAVSDGVIDANEYTHLSTGANGVELFVLFIVMAALKKK